MQRGHVGSRHVPGPWLRDTPARDPGRRCRDAQLPAQRPGPSRGGRDRGGLPSSRLRRPGPGDTSPRGRVDRGKSHGCDTLRRRLPGAPGPGAPGSGQSGGQSGPRRVTAPAGRGLAAGLAETELFFEARRTAFGPPPPAACGKGPQGASAVVVPGPGGGLGPVSCRVCHRPPTGEPRIFPLTSPSVA